MIVFGRALPSIRERTEQDLSLPGLPKGKVLAAVVQLLDKAMIRVGNEEYARTNRHYGLTTMLDRHVDVDGASIQFSFRGKSGKFHRIGVRDRRLARVVKKCQEIPGQVLFQYLDDDGNRTSIDSSGVNEYLKSITTEDFTAKDFRTWWGTVLAVLELRRFEPCESATQVKKNMVEAIKAVAERLGNTPAVCRKCYVHPVVLDSYSNGTFGELVQSCLVQAEGASVPGLDEDEALVLSFLECCISTGKSE